MRSGRGDHRPSGVPDAPADLCTGEPIHLVAVEFSKDDRNLTAFEVAAA